MNQILEKKIKGNQYPFCIAQSSRSFELHSLQRASTKFSCWTVGFPQGYLCTFADSVNTMFFILHSNTIKATPFKYFYRKLAVCRRYKLPVFFEQCFSSPKDKVAHNQNIKELISSKNTKQQGDKNVK